MYTPNPLLNVDETPVQVLGLMDKDRKRKAPKASANSFMIVRAATDGKGRKGPVLFTFSENRTGETISNLLTDYHGVIQTDGLYSYTFAQKNCEFTHLGCLVHARRKAVEANGDGKVGPAFLKNRTSQSGKKFLNRGWKQ